MRSMMLLALVSTAACAGAPPPPPPSGPPPSSVDVAQVRARLLPGEAPFRLLVLAGDGAPDLEVFGLYYGLEAQGWTVTIVAPAKTAVGRQGLPFPVDITLSDVAPGAADVLFVPAGAPTDEAALALVKQYAAGGHLATTRRGAEVLAQAGVTEGRTLADDDAGVAIDGNLISAARPGDLPVLVHALETYAEDTLRAARAAGASAAP